MSTAATPATGSLSASAFAARLPAPPRASAEWSVFSCHVVEPPSYFAATFSEHVLTLQQSGAFRARQSAGGRPLEGWCGAGVVGVVPANRSVAWESLGSCQGSRATSLFIPDAFVSRIVAQDWGAESRKVEIVWQFLRRDPVVESVLNSLSWEAQHDAPSGQLYAESACEFLAHHVIRSYSSLAGSQPRAHGGLAGYRLKAVTDYIHDNLAQPISLRELSEHAGLSPRHFERAFRQATGVPPHVYVTRERVSAAQHLLVSKPRLRIEEIATRVGFRNGSHLAFAFRRRTGYSPRAFRALHSR